MEATFRLALQGFAVSFTAALVLVPLCAFLARRVGVVDKPGGRKTHERSMPLLGGVAVVLAVIIGMAAAVWKADAMASGPDLDLGPIRWVITAALVVFGVGLVDDVFKDSMQFQPKLLGQVAAVLVVMWPNLVDLVQDGGRAAEWFYQFFVLLWYLTIINSFNFSDNMNGLMSGLSIVAFLAAVIYLGTQNSLRSMMLAVVLTGALIGFLPYNFPRSMIFLGDAGSMFVGFCMGWVMLNVTSGFMATSELHLGVSHLIPCVLIMGVPLYDALFVVFMRWREKRPVYLGDDKHLSHRLVRAGFSPAEAVIVLWGIGIFLAGVGTFVAAFATPLYQYLLFALAFACMMAFTLWVISIERTRGAAP